MSHTTSDVVKALTTLKAIGQVLQYWSVQDPLQWTKSYVKVKTEIGKLENGEANALPLFSALWWASLGIDTENRPMVVEGGATTTPDFRKDPWKTVFMNLFLFCMRQGHQVERQREDVKKIVIGRVQSITTEVLSSTLASVPAFRNAARQVVGNPEEPWISKMAFLVQTDAIDPLCPPCEGPLGLRVISKDALFVLRADSPLQTTGFATALVATPVASGVQDRVAAKADLLSVIRTWDERKNTPYARAAQTLVAMALVASPVNDRFWGRVLICYQQWCRNPDRLMTWPYDEWVYREPGKGELVVPPGSRPFGTVQVDLTEDDDMAFRIAAARSRVETAAYAGGASSSSSSAAPKRSYAAETIDEDNYGDASSAERVRQRVRLNDPSEVKAVNDVYQADLARGRAQATAHATAGGSALDRAMANNQQLELGSSRNGVTAVSRGIDPTRVVPYTRPMQWVEVYEKHLALAGGPLDDRKLVPLRWDPRSERISEAKLAPADTTTISTNDLYTGLVRSRQLALGDRPIAHVDEIPVFEPDDELDYTEPGYAKQVTQIQNIQRRNYALMVKDKVPPTEEANQLWFDDLVLKELAHRRNVTDQQGFGPVDVRRPPALQVPQRLDRCTKDLMLRHKWLEYRSDRQLRWSPQLNAERAVQISNYRLELGLMMDLYREFFGQFAAYQAHDTDELRRKHPTLAAALLYCRYLANHIFTLRSIMALNGNPCVLANKNFVNGMRVPGVHVTGLTAIDPIEIMDDAHDGEEPRIELLFQEVFKENFLYLNDYSRELVQSICDRRIRLRISCEELDEYDRSLSMLSDHYDALGLLTAMNPDGTYVVDLSVEEQTRSNKMEEIEIEIMELMRLRWVADRLHLGYLFSDEDFMNEMFAEVQQGLNEELEFARLEDSIYKRKDDQKQELAVRTKLSHCQIDVLIVDGVEVFEEEKALAALNKITADITEEPTDAERQMQAPDLNEPFDVTANDDHLIFVRELFARATEKTIHFNYSAKRDYVSRDNSAPHNFIENRQLSTLSANERQVVEAIRTVEALYSARPSRALHFRNTFDVAWQTRTIKVRDMKRAMQEAVRRREQGSRDVSAEIDAIEAKYGMIPENTASASGFRANRPQAGYNLHGAVLTDNELAQIDAIHGDGAKTDAVLQNLLMERVRRTEDNKEISELVPRQPSPQMQKVAAYIREIGPKLEEARRLAAMAQASVEQQDEQSEHIIATHTEANEAKEMVKVAATIQVAGIGLWSPRTYTDMNEVARHGELLWQVREARTRRMQANRKPPNNPSSTDVAVNKKGRKSKKPVRGPSSDEPLTRPEIHEMEDAAPSVPRLMAYGEEARSDRAIPLPGNGRHRGNPIPMQSDDSPIILGDRRSLPSTDLVIPSRTARREAPPLWPENPTSARLFAPRPLAFPGAATPLPLSRPSVMEIDDDDDGAQPAGANSRPNSQNPPGNWFQRQ